MVNLFLFYGFLADKGCSQIYLRPVDRWANFFRCISEEKKQTFLTFTETRNFAKTYTGVKISKGPTVACRRLEVR